MTSRQRTMAKRQIVQRAGAPRPDGHFDRIYGGFAFGWAADRSNPREKLRVELIEKGALLAYGNATLARRDLLEKQIGDGRCAFQIPLPGWLYDGKDHHISARVAGLDFELGSSPRTLNAETGRCRAAILGMDGTCLKVHVERAGAVAEGCLVVWDGQVEIARLAVPPESGPSIDVRAPLPPELLDGRPHWFRVTLTDPDLVLAQQVLITPFVATPEDALQRYATSFPGHLSASAALRYESLRHHIQALAPAVHNVHEQVVRGFRNGVRNPPALEFAHVEQPTVSVVVPVHNAFATTYNCLASLLLAFNKAPFEVIVVDDGSDDETEHLKALVRGITVLRTASARGFVHSCNMGAEAARGEYLVMLNNDTEVSSGWIDELLHVFRNFDRAGLVGAKLLYPDGTLQEAGGIIFRNADAWNYGRNGNANDPRYNYTRQVDYVSGACIMVPRALWRELGGFDTEFAPAYFEDTDLAYRVRARGYKTLYTPFSRVVHFEGVSNGTDTGSGVKRFQAVNEPKFRARWAAAIRAQDSTRDPELVKDRGISFRALVIDLEVPQPDKDAGSYAAVQEMRLLQSLGFKLTFVPQNLAYLGSYTEALQREGVECLYAPFATSIEEVIRRRAGEFDMYYITRYSVADHYIDLIRSVAPHARIIFNNADLHFLREIRAAIAGGRPDLMEQAAKTREVELSVMRRVDVTLSYTEVEQAVITSHNGNAGRVARCPWVIDPPASVPQFMVRSGIAFLGNYRHLPNMEALAFFVKSVVPLLERRLPGVMLHVYGSNVPDSILALEGKGVRIEGYIADTREAYGRCRVFVAPLLSGAGLKGKVVDALANGVPCVLSPIAAEGIGIREGLEALVAEQPMDWVNAIAAVYEDEGRWTAMSQAARIFVQRQYSFERGRRMMHAALAQAGVFV